MASPVSVFASSNGTDGSLAGWTNPTYAYNDDGVQFATREGTVKNIWYGTLFGFDLSSIPDGAVINSVTLSAEWKNSTNDTSGPVLYLGAQSGGSEVGVGDSDLTGQTTFEVLTHAVTGLTAAQLKATGASGFWAILRFRRTDNTAHIASVDYVKCVVEYTEPATLLAIQDAAQTQATDTPGMVQHHTLEIQDVSQGQGAEDLALIQHNTLAIADVSQAQASETPSLPFHEPTTSLVIQDVTQTQAVDTPGLTQHSILTISDVAQAQATDTPGMSQHNILSIADASQGQAADSLNMVQHNSLSIADAVQGQSAENISLVDHAPGGVILTIADAAQCQITDIPALTQHHILTTQDVAQMQTAENLSLTADEPSTISLAIQDAAQLQLAELVQLSCGGRKNKTILAGVFLGIEEGIG